MNDRRPLVRPATLDDADALAVLAERTFRDTFSADNTADDIEMHVRASFGRDTVRAELEDPASTVLLAFSRGEPDGKPSGPVGYAKLRAGRAEASVRGPDPIELERLYVDRSALGLGLGAALMAACLETASTRGHRTLWLGVWERNARAIAFYAKWGFSVVGDHVFRLGSDDQRDLIMERPVQRLEHEPPGSAG